jgi:predicted ATPase
VRGPPPASLNLVLRLVETYNFRMLPANRVALGRFHVLVGQNATGKSTFISAVQLVSDVIRLGAKRAVEEHGATFPELCFDPGQPIAFALEIEVPKADGGKADLRYELELGMDVGNGGGLHVLHENLYILQKASELAEPKQASLFGPVLAEAHPIRKAPSGWRRVVGKTFEGRDYFRDERTDWNNMFRFGPDRAALGSLPEDPDRFPLSIAGRDFLRDAVRQLALDPRELRAPSPPGGTPQLALDGSNLPYVVLDLQQRDPILFAQWVRHLATGVQGLTHVSVRERPEDRYLVLEATFEGSHLHPVPSWLLSDGTLRLMALTLLSFASKLSGGELYLIEEPENGLHPLAIQTVFDALSLSTGAQILCATHSPIFLAQVKLEDALVFRRAPEGYAIVRRGPEVPELANWPGRTNLAALFATGVLS